MNVIINKSANQAEAVWYESQLQLADLFANRFVLMNLRE